jgi:hypothetical protein
MFSGQVVVMFNSRLHKTRVFAQRDKLLAPMTIELMPQPHADDDCVIEDSQTETNNKTTTIVSEQNKDDDIEVVGELKQPTDDKAADPVVPTDTHKIDITKLPTLWEGAPEFQWRSELSHKCGIIYV